MTVWQRVDSCKNSGVCRGGYYGTLSACKYTRTSPKWKNDLPVKSLLCSLCLWHLSVSKEDTACPPGCQKKITSKVIYKRPTNKVKKRTLAPSRNAGYTRSAVSCYGLPCWSERPTKGRRFRETTSSLTNGSIISSSPLHSLPIPQRWASSLCLRSE